MVSQGIIQVAAPGDHLDDQSVGEGEMFCMCVCLGILSWSIIRENESA